MATIDEKVNMSLDEIIKLERKEKKKKAVPANGRGSLKFNRGAARGKGPRGRGAGRAMQSNAVKGQVPRINKRFNNGGLRKSRSNVSINNVARNFRGGYANRRGRGGRFGLSRGRSKAYNQGGFFANNKGLLSRAASLQNLRDPMSVHNRLGYQSAAQVAYRNRVKRAKQVLLRQSQRLNLQNDYQVPQTGKLLTNLHPRLMERRQQIFTPHRRFTTGGLRSDQILRAQRRAQYEQKLMRMNSVQRAANTNVNFTCTMGDDYLPTSRARAMTMARTQNAGSLRQLPRGRSPFRQNMQHLDMMDRSPYHRQRSRSRSRSRSRTRNDTTMDSSSELDDRSFSEVMYTLSGSLGVTGRTLNDRFSF